MLNFKLKNKSLTTIVSLLTLAYVVQVLVYIMNHVYRLTLEGRICSGSFLTEEEWKDEKMLENYINSRGSFLWVLLVVKWAIVGIACIICSVWTARHFRG